MLYSAFLCLHMSQLFSLVTVRGWYVCMTCMSKLYFIGHSEGLVGRLTMYTFIGHNKCLVCMSWVNRLSSLTVRMVK